MKNSLEERKNLSAVLVDSHLCPTLEGPTRAPILISHVIRSHGQQLATTCNLSMLGRYPRIRVRGRSWSSVAVDVATDVDERGRRLRALAGRVCACRAPDSRSVVWEWIHLVRLIVRALWAAPDHQTSVIHLKESSRGRRAGLAVAFATGLGWVAITARSVVWPRVGPP